MDGMDGTDRVAGMGDIDDPECQDNMGDMDDSGGMDVPEHIDDMPDPAH